MWGSILRGTLNVFEPLLVQGWQGWVGLGVKGQGLGVKEIAQMMSPQYGANWP